MHKSFACPPREPRKEDDDEEAEHEESDESAEPLDEERERPRRHLRLRPLRRPPLDRPADARTGRHGRVPFARVEDGPVDGGTFGEAKGPEVRVDVVADVAV